MRLCLGLLLFFLAHLSLFSQNEFVVIDSIKIEGHKKTKGPIIFRELLFQAGDTIPFEKLNQKLEGSKQNLLNTTLFNHVELNIISWGYDNKIKIEVEVFETWYFFPTPIFELADRNFNVWWEDQNKALDRINLGFRLKYLNMSGHRDELKAIFHTGYTQKYELDYTFPYVDRNKTFGVNGNILYLKNKELNYANILNKQAFHSEDDLDLFQRFRIKLGLSYRPSFYFTHRITYEYHYNEIHPFVVNELNPDYFGNGNTEQEFHLVEYVFEADKRDFRLYPLRGIYFQGKVRRVGFGNDSQNHLTIRGQFHQTYPVMQKSAVTNQTIIQTTIERKERFFNQLAAHGYGDDYLRGYELYVINGQSFFLNKTKGKWHLWNKVINWKKWMPVKSFRIMPASIYFTTNFDVGYVHRRPEDQNNQLANQWLHGYGVGLDIVLYNNYAYTIEYSINQLNERGIYLHFNVGL